MLIHANEITDLIAAVEKGAAERVATQGMDEAHTIAFACGAMTVFHALGIWDSVPMKWHLFAQSGRDPFTGTGLPATPPERWPVLHITKGDLQARGFDTSEVDESEMEQLASEMGDQEHLMATYWLTLEHVAERLGFVQVEDDDDDTDED